MARALTLRRPWTSHQPCRLFRPQLETLEGRLAPGDTLGILALSGRMFSQANAATGVVQSEAKEYAVADQGQEPWILAGLFSGDRLFASSDLSNSSRESQPPDAAPGGDRHGSSRNLFGEPWDDSSVNAGRGPITDTGATAALDRSVRPESATLPGLVEPDYPAVAATNLALFTPTALAGESQLTVPSIATSAQADAAATPTGVEPVNSDQVRANLSRLPLSFEANVGQTDGQVRYLARGHGFTLFLTSTEAVTVLNRPNQPVSTQAGIILSGSSHGNQKCGGQATTLNNATTDVVRMQFVGANATPAISAQELLPGVSNYFIGQDPRNWHTEVAHYGRVAYQNLYTGVDLVFHGTQQNQLEYDFVVAPGADPGVVQLAFAGVDSLRVDDQGNLHLKTGESEMVQHAPVSYQEVNGARSSVAGRFVVSDGRRVSFAVGAYDLSRPLIIDPVVLNYSVRFGGTLDDVGNSVAVDGNGNAYVTGFTASTNFPVVNPFVWPRDPTLNGDHKHGGIDAFVTKLAADGSQLLYSSYLGGSVYTGPDHAEGPCVASERLPGPPNQAGTGIAVDTNGSAYVTGWTEASNFPVTPTAWLHDKPLSVVQTGFVTKLNGTGDTILYSTYLGRDKLNEVPDPCSRYHEYNQIAYAITVDDAGFAYVTGQTVGTIVPYYCSLPPNYWHTNNVFLATINTVGPTTTPPDWEIGGTRGFQSGQGIARNASGSVAVTGWTNADDFPTTFGVFQPSLAGDYPGSYNAFVLKRGPDAYSTYLGGPTNGIALCPSIVSQSGTAIALDPGGNAYVTGFTDSAAFPTTPGAYREQADGLRAAFLTKVNATGTQKLFSTYLGGPGTTSYGVSLQFSGGLYYPWVAGETGPSFPTTPNATQPYFSGSDTNAFLTKFKADGSAPLLFSTFLGDPGPEGAYGLAGYTSVDGVYHAYLTGYVGSPPYRDVFVAKFSDQ